ncbi:MAG: hypothetical protein D6687_08090 [Acidobacteria bacterium]|jgi:hypothetical protein|nr:MAG: hypothetical protein D6687_08090 [Acidobacteriota bacterium]GIU81535.1 MAG: hypothetical protein KatS3mg006_0599 [Pyrinomonadaceae bacterium]
MIVEIFDKQFLDLHKRSCELILKIPEKKLYWQPEEANSFFPMHSCGECILRSAGAVEQTFGGITTRLWDDPFEWTLPEALSTKEKILKYLEEVEQTRRRGFALFTSDEDLKKQIPAPVKLKPIFQILLETLARAEHFQGRAFAIFQLLTSRKREEDS